MTETERLIAAIESLGGKMDMLGNKLDIVGRAVIADTTEVKKLASSVTALMHDFLGVKERIEFIAQNTKVRRREMPKAVGR